MGKVCCGHWDFRVHDNWILCQDCDCGIAIDSTKGQRLLGRKRGGPLLNPQQQAVYDSLVESYKKLINEAKTSNPERLADWVNRNPNQ